MNVFLNKKVAQSYDAYYNTPPGLKIDTIEKSLVAQHLKEVPKNNMLELGCGTGHWTGYLLQNGFQPIAGDISDEMLKIARNNLPAIDFSTIDATNLNFNDRSFDSVFSITMLEFVENQDLALKEIYRILKPGGYLLLGCLNLNSIIGINKENDDTFRLAKLLTESELTNKLKLFGTPKILKGVYLNEKFELIENLKQQQNIEPAFMAALVQKTN